MKKYFSNQSSKYLNEDKRPTSPYSHGRAVPKSGGLEACLCADKLTYSKKCCNGYLINQGIGVTMTPYPTYDQPGRAFSAGFNNGFS